MNRPLLETVLTQMKEGLRAGETIGDLKIAALFALGSQLEAIFYYLGHELASKFDVNPANEPDPIVRQLQDICAKYHLGTIQPTQKTPQQITFTLANGYSTRFVKTDQLRTQNTFCSFEAGLFAGLVEKMTKNHVFAQEINCKCQGKPACEFMVVFA
jgi:predicted hydrocarbon binding protein